MVDLETSINVKDIMGVALTPAGVSKARTPTAKEARLALLQTEEGLKALASRISRTYSHASRQTLLGAYKSGYYGYQKRLGNNINTLDNSAILPGEISYETITTTPFLIDLDRLDQTAYSLFGYPNSPLYEYAREIEREQNQNLHPYIPGTPNTYEFENATLAEMVQLNLDSIPEGYVAYDIETDNSNGYGLRPHLTMITELSLSTKEETIVFSGDEQHILQKFTNFMNNDLDGRTLIGWNINSFDNIVLHVRKQAHPHINNWNGELTPLPRRRTFNPSGGYETPQRLIWTLPDGSVTGTTDAFASIVFHPDYPQGMPWALKKLARTLGAAPIELDRERLDDYLEEERARYAASDTLVTLFVFNEMWKQLYSEFL